MPSCVELGNALIAAAEAPAGASHTQGAALLDAACGAGQVSGCAPAARALLAGGRNRRNERLAERLLRRGVEANDAPSAYIYGRLLAERRPPDRVRALTYLSRACTADLPSACHFGAELVARASSTEDETLPGAEIVLLLGGSCEADSAHACELAGLRLRDAVGVPADPARAALYLERACLGRETSACAPAAELIAASGPVDARRLGRLEASACLASDAEACERAMRHLRTLEAREDLALASRAALRGCELGRPLCCLGAAEMAREGQGIPRDRDLALDRYAGICTAGVAAGCGGLLGLCGEGYLGACERLIGTCEAGIDDACRLVPEGGAR
ncbi:MAG: hypothetical protein OEY14_13870 [Myxococcales bacterium]|nr:hypothetical protein [Myxococcales bacterium]